jgi:hypothetical protein
LTKTARALVDEYLVHTRAELTSLPPDRAAEILEDVEEHIASSLPNLDVASEADVRNVLEQLGPPLRLGQAARETFAVSQQSSTRWHEAAAILLTPLVWPVGLLFLWTSRAWSVKDKLLATLIVPGGLWLAFVLSRFIIPGRSCTSHMAANSQFIRDMCVPSDLEIALRLGLEICLFLAPICTAVYLAIRLQRSRTPAQRAHGASTN